MSNFLREIISNLEYPDSDGWPMAESDVAREYLIYAIEGLRIYFQNRLNVYVSGNLFLYYEQGNPKAVIAPDVFVVFGVENKKRVSYKVWEENNKIPDFILEITSKSTVSEDQGIKKGLYAYLGVKEYFQYDPTSDYLQPPLQGLHLVEGNYFPIAAQETESGLAIFSEILGLELRTYADGAMRFYDPTTSETLRTPQELEEARLAEQQKAEKMAARLRELGINPDEI
jgi:Uma2 family endonuclease